MYRYEIKKHMLQILLIRTMQTCKSYEEYSIDFKKFLLTLVWKLAQLAVYNHIFID